MRSRELKLLRARIARRQFATCITGPEDDVPQRYGRTRGKTRRLDHDSSSVVRENVFEVVQKPSVTVGRMDDSGDDLLELDLEDVTQAFQALLPEDQLNMQHDGPIWKQRSLEDAERQSYRTACDSVNGDIWLGAMTTTRSTSRSYRLDGCYLRQAGRRFETEPSWGSGSREGSPGGKGGSTKGMGGFSRYV